MKYLLTAIFLIHAIVMSSQNIYGVSGVIYTPDAYAVGNGKMVLTASAHNDQFALPAKDIGRIGQWAVALNFGLHSRIEAGIRLVGVPSLNYKATTLPYHFTTDRNVNLKFIIFKEKTMLPQLAIGIQDFAGTRKFNCTALVLGKNITLKKGPCLILNLGYGTRLSKILYDYPPDGYRLQGVFGSIGIQYPWVKVLGEYESGSFNAGIELLVMKSVSIKLFYSASKYPGALASFSADL